MWSKWFLAMANTFTHYVCTYEASDTGVNMHYGTACKVQSTFLEQPACGGSCCITTDFSSADQTCSEAKIQLAGKGTRCVTEPSCPQNQLQLCQANNQCPEGKYCSPVRILGGFTVNDTILGVCVP